MAKDAFGRDVEFDVNVTNEVLKTVLENDVKMTANPRTVTREKQTSALLSEILDALKKLTGQNIDKDVKDLAEIMKKNIEEVKKVRDKKLETKGIKNSLESAADKVGEFSEKLKMAQGDIAKGFRASARVFEIEFPKMASAIGKVSSSIGRLKALDPREYLIKIKDQLGNAFGAAGEAISYHVQEILRGAGEGMRIAGTFLKDKVAGWTPEWLKGIGKVMAPMGVALKRAMGRFGDAPVLEAAGMETEGLADAIGGGAVDATEEALSDFFEGGAGGVGIGDLCACICECIEKLEGKGGGKALGALHPEKLIGMAKGLREVGKEAAETLGLKGVDPDVLERFGEAVKSSAEEAKKSGMEYHFLRERFRTRVIRMGEAFLSEDPVKTLLQNMSLEFAALINNVTQMTGKMAIGFFQFLTKGFGKVFTTLGKIGGRFVGTMFEGLGKMLGKLGGAFGKLIPGVVGVGEGLEVLINFLSRPLIAQADYFQQLRDVQFQTMGIGRGLGETAFAEAFPQVNPAIARLLDPEENAKAQQRMAVTLEMVDETGQSLATVQKAQLANLRRGIRWNEKINRVTSIGLSTAKLVGASAEETNNLFGDWSQHLQIGTLQLAQMGRDLRSIARMTGVTGDNLIKVARSAETFMKNMRNAGNFTTMAARNMTAMLAEAQRTGTSEGMQNILGVLSSGTIAGAGDERIKNLVRVATGGQRDLVEAVLGGTITQNTDQMRALGEGLEGLINRFTGGRRLEDLSPARRGMISQIFQSQFGVGLNELNLIIKNIRKATMSFGERLEQLTVLQGDANARLKEGTTLQTVLEQKRALVQDRALQFLTDFATGAKTDTEKFLADMRRAGVEIRGAAPETAIRAVVEDMNRRIRQFKPPGVEEIDVAKVLAEAQGPEGAAAALEKLNQTNQKIVAEQQAQNNPVSQILKVLQRIESILLTAFTGKIAGLQPVIDEFLGAFNNPEVWKQIQGGNIFGAFGTFWDKFKNIGLEFAKGSDLLGLIPKNILGNLIPKDLLDKLDQLRAGLSAVGAVATLANTFLQFAVAIGKITGAIAMIPVKLLGLDKLFNMLVGAKAGSWAEFFENFAQNATLMADKFEKMGNDVSGWISKATDAVAGWLHKILGAIVDGFMQMKIGLLKIGKLVSDMAAWVLGGEFKETAKWFDNQLEVAKFEEKMQARIVQEQTKLEEQAVALEKAADAMKKKSEGATPEEKKKFEAEEDLLRRRAKWARGSIPGIENVYMQQLEEYKKLLQKQLDEMKKKRQEEDKKNRPVGPQIPGIWEFRVKEGSIADWLFGGKEKGPDIPGQALGTDMLTKSGLFYGHAGEMIVPAMPGALDSGPSTLFKQAYMQPHLPGMDDTEMAIKKKQMMQDGKSMDDNVEKTAKNTDTMVGQLGVIANYLRPRRSRGSGYKDTGEDIPDAVLLADQLDTEYVNGTVNYLPGMNASFVRPT